MQHERAPRGKNSHANARNSLGGSKGKSKNSISKVKYEKELLSSEPNSPYSSSISTEQWNELESSTDAVFLSFDSRLKNEDDELHSSLNNDSLIGHSKSTSDIPSVITEKANLGRLDENKRNMHHLEQVAREGSEHFQASTSSTEGESSTNYDENKSKNDNKKQNYVIQTTISNSINDHDNHNETKYASTKENYSYTNSSVTNVNSFSDYGGQAEFCSPAIFSLYDSSVQLLYTSVSWARSIPMFMDLPFRDQAILLEEAWSELFLLNAVHYYLPVDMSTLSSATGLSPSQTHASNLIKEIRTLQNVVARFHQLQMDTVEYACLKAVVLFKSGMLFFQLSSIRVFHAG